MDKTSELGLVTVAFIAGVALCYWALRFVAARFAQPKTAALVAALVLCGAGALTGAGLIVILPVVAVCLLIDMAKEAPKPKPEDTGESEEEEH